MKLKLRPGLEDSDCQCLCLPGLFDGAEIVGGYVETRVFPGVL